MSRGLGRYQMEIIKAMAEDPERRWGRIELQQAAWGPQPGSRPELLKRYSRGDRPRKNVSWWKDGKQRFESAFTRALQSLERRELVWSERGTDHDGNPRGHTGWQITSAGFKAVTGFDSSY
jgi:hypothetical protein